MLQLVVMAAALVPVGASAQPSNLRIGFVDVQVVMGQAPQVTKAMQALQDEFAPRGRELEQMEAEVREKQTRFDTDAAVMSQEQRTQLEREIRDGVRELERKNREVQEDLELRRNEEIVAVQNEISEHVAKFAEDQGYDLILQNVVYRSPRTDITAQVIEYLGERAQ